MQFQKRDFRRTAEAHGQNDRADAARDINLRFFAPVKSTRKFAARQNSFFVGADFHLSAVRVTAQHQINFGAGGAIQSFRIVRQQ